MQPKNTWKILGLVAAVAAFAINMLSDYAAEQRQDEVIEEKITKALSEAKEEN